ncbi:MAG: penicillin-binding protein 2 [Bacteroidia bacterium]|nr:penicillin-binding protein 2 [Bacteroidia bacterium]
MERLEQRGYYVLAFVGLIFLIYIGRLFSIQVLSEEYANRAEGQVVATQTVVPPRGNIYNRKGDIYVDNRPIFSLMVTPSELSIPDTTRLCLHLGIDKEELDKRLSKIFKNKRARWQEHVLARYLEPNQYGALKELFWNFSGVSFQATNKRYYQYPVGANILGYIREVNPSEIAENPQKYHRGDLIGNSGIERSYDDVLRGQQGTRKVLKDNLGRVVGLYKNSSLNVTAVRGPDMMIGIDTDLQALGEELMQNKKGSIVAIDPSTGEILAFVSAPVYNPGDLTGKLLDESYGKLKEDPNNPLFNRPLMAKYPPGSIFKVAMALAALDAGIINPNTYYGCGGGFKRNKGKPGCRMHVSPLSLKDAIKYSCNSYFAATYMDYLHEPSYDSIYAAYNSWYGYMYRMGIGHALSVDLPYEKGGSLPTTAMYDDARRWYGHNRWSATTIISNAIGQGEIEMTPLQMANLVSLVANRGKYYPPHLRVATRDKQEQAWVREHYDLIDTQIDPEHVEVVIDAMEEVVQFGTGRRAFLTDFHVCGKTGTVENSHGEDHATFIGFAPRDNPRIAIAVIIENAGGGGSWAAPTAAVLMEKYLTGKVVEKRGEMERILAADFITQ